MVKCTGLSLEPTCFQPSSISSAVNLAKLRILSRPQFLHLQNGVGDQGHPFMESQRSP